MKDIIGDILSFAIMYYLIVWLFGESCESEVTKEEIKETVAATVSATREILEAAKKAAADTATIDVDSLYGWEGFGIEKGVFDRLYNRN